MRSLPEASRCRDRALVGSDRTQKPPLEHVLEDHDESASGQLPMLGVDSPRLRRCGLGRPAEFAYLEAWSCGMPAIVSEIGSLLDVMREVEGA